MEKEFDYQQLLEKAFEKLPKKMEAKRRFEIPQASLEVIGSKSRLKNFGEILTILRRDAKHLAKYFFRELATAGFVEGNVLVFQGKISRENLQRKLNEYTKEFVYCKECGEPDTKLVKEERITFIVCDACGARHTARSI